MISSGSTGYYLTLTNPGTSGTFTYQYVGGALLIGSSSGTSVWNGSINALAYGYPTASAVVPRSGQADYAIDMLGASSTNCCIIPFTGQGDLAVNFSSGSVFFNAQEYIGGNPSGNIGYSGKLSSSGTFSGGSAGAWSFSGRFYGPVAQEVGGSFSSTVGSGASASVYVGTFVGRVVPTPTPTPTAMPFPRIR